MALIRYLGNRGAQDTAIEEPDADGSKNLVSGNEAFFLRRTYALGMLWRSQKTKTGL